MDQQRVLVFGSNGQLGSALRHELPDATFVDLAEFDVTDPKRYGQEDWGKFETLINAAAFTAVDAAETAEGRVAAWLVNASAVGLMADTANKHNLTLVHISSDYVFDGTKTEHYEDESFSPLGVYGQSKAAGDIAAARATKHYIVRTSWVVGEGHNFVRTMRSLAEKDVSPKVVGDQFGRLTITEDLSRAVIVLLEKNAPFGTYNFSNDGDIVTWAEIAKSVYREVGKDPDSVTATTTAEYYKDKPEVPPRPVHSALVLEKIRKVGVEPRDWRVALGEYLRKEK